MRNDNIQVRFWDTLAQGIIFRWLECKGATYDLTNSRLECCSFAYIPPLLAGVVILNLRIYGDASPRSNERARLWIMVVQLVQKGMSQDS